MNNNELNLNELIEKPFDLPLLNETQNSDFLYLNLNSQSITLAVIIIIFIIISKPIGTKSFLDPLYLKGISAGSLLEICKKVKTSKLLISCCFIWKLLASFLFAMIWVDIGGLIISAISKAAIPQFYIAALIIIFLFTTIFALLSKLFVCAIFYKNRSNYNNVKISECFD